MSEPERNLWPALAGLLAAACCLGLPLILAAGAAVALYVFAGIGVAAGVLVAGALVLVRLHRRAAARTQRADASWRAHFARPPLASSPKRKSG